MIFLYSIWKIANSYSVILSPLKSTFGPEFLLAFFFFSLFENRFFSHPIHPNYNFPLPPLLPAFPYHFSPLHLFLLSFPLEKIRPPRDNNQAHERRYNKTRQKPCLIRDGQRNPTGGRVPRTGKRVRDTLISTVKCPTKHQVTAISCTEDLVYTHTG